LNREVYSCPICIIWQDPPSPACPVFDAECPPFLFAVGIRKKITFFCPFDLVSSKLFRRIFSAPDVDPFLRSVLPLLALIAAQQIVDMCPSRSAPVSRGHFLSVYSHLTCQPFHNCNLFFFPFFFLFFPGLPFSDSGRQRLKTPPEWFSYSFSEKTLGLFSGVYPCFLSVRCVGAFWREVRLFQAMRRNLSHALDHVYDERIRLPLFFFKLPYVPLTHFLSALPSSPQGLDSRFSPARSGVLMPPLLYHNE